MGIWATALRQALDEMYGRAKAANDASGGSRPFKSACLPALLVKASSRRSQSVAIGRPAQNRSLSVTPTPIVVWFQS